MIKLTSLRRNQISVASLFFILGFNFGTWASRIPALKAQLNISNAEVGLVLLASGLGAVFSFPITTTLLQKLGSRKLCILAGGLIPLVLLGLAANHSFQFALILMALEGILASCLNMAMNAQGVAIETHGKTAIMSRLHAIFSLGGMAAALFTSVLTHFSDSINMHFWVSACLLWLILAFASRHLFHDQSHLNLSTNTKRFMLPNGMALWLGFIAFLGTIIEGSMSDWSALYLQERTATSVELSSLGIAAVSGAMLLARWFGDSWRQRWGAQRLLTVGSLLAGSGLLFALSIGGLSSALFGFAMVGLGVAAVSPCVYSAAAKNGAVALASVTTMGSIGALLGPPFIGFIAHSSNLTWGMVIIAVAALLIAICTRKVSWT